MEVDTKKWVNLDELDSDFVPIEYVEEVKELAKEAYCYLLSFPWCLSINKGWLVYSCGYVIGLFYFEIVPDVAKGADSHVWVIVGDLPSAYIDILSASSAHSALDLYIRLMEEWASKVNNGEDTSDCYPINVPETKEYADMLTIRMNLLKEAVPISTEPRQGLKLGRTRYPKRVHFLSVQNLVRGSLSVEIGRHGFSTTPKGLHDVRAMNPLTGIE